MARKGKNIRVEKSGFLRYRKGEMTGRERNAFERDLQKDPFAEEAADGFELLSPVELQDDLSKLTKKLKARTTRKKSLVLYRIAASVAVLMIVSSVFIVVNRKNNIARSSMTVQEQVPFTIARSEPVRPAPETSDQAVPQQQRERAKKELYVAVEEQPSKKAAEPADINIEKEEAPQKVPEQKIAEEPVVAERRAIADEAAARMPAGAAAEKSLRTSIPATQITGQVISTEDSMPLPGASVMIKGTNKGTITDAHGNFSLDIPQKETVTLVASSIGMTTVELPASSERPLQITLQPDVASLSEVVVTGYGTRAKREEGSSSYNPPQPVNGRTAYNRYIDANIRRPDSSTAGQRAVVVARFPVLADGTTGSINILRTPGEEFSREAIRLIKSGPSWKPALRDGVAVEDSVTLRIVFK
jgi:hypothetical protein